MAINKPHTYDRGLYFVTFTNYKWMPLFENTQSYDIVYKWFDILKSQCHEIVGYVIMPNHVHALIGFQPGKKSINTIVGDGKRFMAYDIIVRLKMAENEKLLKILADGVLPSDRQRGKQHEVFQSSFDMKLCRTYKFVQQKLDYIHANPVSKKWMLANNAIEYVHSSAKFYETGEQGIYDVMHANEWMHKNWDGIDINEVNSEVDG